MHGYLPADIREVFMKDFYKRLAIVSTALCIAGASSIGGYFIGKRRQARYSAGIYSVTYTLPSGEGITPEDTIQLLPSNELIFNNTDATVFTERYDLPSLPAAGQSSAKDLKVMKRAANLNVAQDLCLKPEAAWKSIVNNFVPLKEAEQKVEFEGTSASELNQVIRENTAVHVTSQAIDLDETIVLKDGVQLYFEGTELKDSGKTEYAVLGDHVKNVVVKGAAVHGAVNGIYLVEPEHAEITDNEISGCVKRPLTVIGGSSVYLSENMITENGHGGIYTCGDLHDSIIEANRVQHNYGTSNWMAGIVLCSVELEDVMNPDTTFDDNLHFPNNTRSLDDMLTAPHNVVVYGNSVCNNNSSGVYCDGSYLTYILNNDIQSNDKEGMCLDYGTLGTYVAGNDIGFNGFRARQSDKDLDMDFVGGFGRLADGSSPAKLPGVSLDNTLWNILTENNVHDNAGSGIKSVRTTAQNIIAMNVVNDNNAGASDVFHFFGIELGAAISDTEEDIVMNFTADDENIVARNMISGMHSSGVYMAQGCRKNQIVQNVIYGVTYMEVEDLSGQSNTISDNIQKK